MLLLAAQEGGRPLNEAAWILIAATLTTAVDAYATHLSQRSYGDLRAHANSLWVGLMEDSPRVVAGYETIAMNINVVVLFLYAILAARRSGSTWRGTILFGLMNAVLGWLIVTVELALE